MFFTIEAPSADAAVASFALKDVCFGSLGCNGVNFVVLIQSDDAQIASTRMVCLFAVSGKDQSVNSDADDASGCRKQPVPLTLFVLVKLGEKFP